MAPSPEIAPEAARTLPAGRQLEMARFLAERPSTVVDLPSLARRFGVSEQTIRRDLKRLEGRGLVRRTFGGAIVQEPARREEPSFHEREHLNASGKGAIAREALKLLRDGEGVFFDASSTVLHLVRRLPADWSGDATTAGLPALNELVGREEVSVTVLGGGYERRSRCIRGGPARQQLEGLRFDRAFISARALHTELGLCEASPGEAELKRALFGSAAHVIALIDSTKLGATAAHHYAGLDQVDLIITDDGLDPPAARQLRDHVPGLIVARTSAEL